VVPAPWAINIIDIILMLLDRVSRRCGRQRNTNRFSPLAHRNIMRPRRLQQHDHRLILCTQRCYLVMIRIDHGINKPQFYNVNSKFTAALFTSWLVTPVKCRSQDINLKFGTTLSTSVKRSGVTRARASSCRKLIVGQSCGPKLHIDVFTPHSLTSLQQSCVQKAYTSSRESLVSERYQIILLGDAGWHVALPLQKHP